jgi:hypothetical protein
MPISPDRTLQRREGVLSAAVDDEIVLLSPALAQYVALCPIGRRVWELLETPQSPAALAARLTTEFAASEAAILADVLSFLEELGRDGLIGPV